MPGWNPNGERASRSSRPTFAATISGAPLRLPRARTALWREKRKGAFDGNVGFGWPCPKSARRCGRSTILSGGRAGAPRAWAVPGCVACRGTKRKALVGRFQDWFRHGHRVCGPMASRLEAFPEQPHAAAKSPFTPNSRRWHSELGVRRAWRRSAAACVQDEHPCVDSLTDSFDKQILCHRLKFTVDGSLDGGDFFVSLHGTCHKATLDTAFVPVVRYSNDSEWSSHPAGSVTSAFGGGSQSRFSSRSLFNLPASCHLVQDDRPCLKSVLLACSLLHIGRSLEGRVAKIHAERGLQEAATCLRFGAGWESSEINDTCS